MCYCPLGLPPHMPKPSPTSLWRRGKLLCHIAGGDQRYNSWNSIQLQLEVQVLKSVFQGSCPPGCRGSSCLSCSNDDICTKVSRVRQVNLGFEEWQQGKYLIMIIQTLTSTPKVRETGCSLTSPGIIASEDFLTKDECHHFCSGLRTVYLQLSKSLP